MLGHKYGLQIVKMATLLLKASLEIVCTSETLGSLSAPLTQQFPPKGHEG